MLSALNLNSSPTQCCIVVKELAKAISAPQDSKIKQEKIGSLFTNYKFLMCSTTSLQENKLVASSRTERAVSSGNDPDIDPLTLLELFGSKPVRDLTLKPCFSMLFLMERLPVRIHWQQRWFVITVQNGGIFVRST